MGILNKQIIITGSEEGWLTVRNKNSVKKGISQKISRNKIITIQVLKKSKFITYDSQCVKFWDYAGRGFRKSSEKPINDMAHVHIDSNNKMITFSNKALI